jgi:L-ascorbate metabolism protein UlaG (beta-lactamase superfamily)
MFTYDNVTFHWLGHDGFRIEAGPLVIYIDPFKLSPAAVKPASLVLLTHEHFDHCSVEDLRKVVTPTTTVICPQECLSALSKVRPGDVIPVRPGEKRSVAGITVSAVSAYNVNKYRDPATKQVFHPKVDEKVGYVLDVGSVRVYHAGDTDNIPEMARISCDIALLPVSGTYVMTAEEAADAARAIKPKVAIPMHYGSIVGDDSNAKTFERLLAGSGIRVEILKKE